MKDFEKRALKGIELRSEEGKPSVLVGYAALFNSRSLDLGGFFEVIRKGAFKRSLEANDDILALAHHDRSRPLARRSKGTLKLEEDDKGLRVEITLNDSSSARDVLADVKSGNIEGMSFSFSTINDEVTRADGIVLRELIDVELHEVSPVTMPAYPETSIAARSVQSAIGNTGDTAASDRLNAARLKLLSMTL
jgi:HK97 family phage prohead protease